jgi:hypothetical protein
VLAAGMGPLLWIVVIVIVVAALWYFFMRGRSAP